LIRFIQTLIELLLQPATGEGWDGGDTCYEDTPIPAFPHGREGRRHIKPPPREYWNKSHTQHNAN
jgi:hypothetical protein